MRPFFRYFDWSPGLEVDFLCPIDHYEWLSRYQCPGSAVEHVEEPVAVGLEPDGRLLRGAGGGRAGSSAAQGSLYTEVERPKKG